MVKHSIQYCIGTKDQPFDQKKSNFDQKSKPTGHFSYSRYYTFLVYYMDRPFDALIFVKAAIGGIELGRSPVYGV